MLKKIISVSVVCIAVMFFAAACAKNADGVAELVETGDKTVVIRALKTDTSVSLADAMQSLKEEGKLDFTAQDGDYGLQILSVNGYTPDAGKNEFFAVYTTLGEYEGTAYSDETWGFFEYGGKRLNSAAYGVSGLPMVEGELYIITVSTY